MRLKNWDYRWDAAYFITICTLDRARFFGKVEHNKMQLSKIGLIANQCWYQIPVHFPFVRLGEFIVMPDHIHGIITISNSFETLIADKKDFHALKHDFERLKVTIRGSKPKIQPLNKLSPKSGSLSAIIRSYKAAVTREARLSQFEFGWQSKFYDHIIRDHVAYQKISYYIKNNPLKWSKSNRSK